jgi:hypothetical protein
VCVEPSVAEDLWLRKQTTPYYSTLLKANGEGVKTVQELVRHANRKITLDTYTQAMSPTKRQAQSKVARLILPKKTAGRERSLAYRTDVEEAESR